MNKSLIAGCAVGFAALWTVSACALRVRSDVNSALIASAHCSTFAWAGSFRGNSPLRSTLASPLNESRLRAAISANLATSGVQPAESNADCLVGYGIGSRRVVEGVYYGWGWGWGGGYPWGWDPYVYSEGIVAVDLYDAKSRQPLWHASVDQDVSGLSGADAEKKIKAAIDAIFAKYPAQLGGGRPHGAGGGSPG